jgi:hypothetical protein
MLDITHLHALALLTARATVAAGVLLGLLLGLMIFRSERSRLEH